MKDKIRYHAIRLFDRDGFHGTSMRDIADAAGCKTPTVYHHYKSKEDLFDEVVRVAYLDLLSAQRELLPEIIAPEDYCVESLIQKKRLSEEASSNGTTEAKVNSSIKTSITKINPAMGAL